MDKIIRNLRDCLLAKKNGKKVPNLFRSKITKETYGNYCYFAFNDDGVDSKITSISIIVEKEKVSLIKNIFNKQKTYIYKMRLVVDCSNTDKKFNFNSKEKPIIKEIYHLMDDCIDTYHEKTIKYLNEITKADISLVNNNNITHNF